MFDHKKFLKSCSLEPGVYEMSDSKGIIIYVGKAKNLKNRLTSYFNKNVSLKTAKLVSQIVKIKTTITGTEKEALILEANLIKKYKPKYNVLLRDDKSYPFIILDDKEYPRLDLYRGLKTDKKLKNFEFFGPYPSGYYARQTIYLLQKVFLLRNCTDTFFKNRSRPCMQYQINRCSAPCVDYISKEDYKKSIQNAKLFLTGKNNELIQNFVKAMNQASSSLDYELAAKLRDKIKILQDIQQQQYIVGREDKNIDLIILANFNNKFCISLNKVRNGAFVSTEQYFINDVTQNDLDNELAVYNFISQYYLSDTLTDYPNEILINESLIDKKLINDALSLKNKKIKILDDIANKKSIFKKYEKWINLATQNLQHNIYKKYNDSNKFYNYEEHFNKLEEFFNKKTIEKIECYDISHTSGHFTVASQVTFLKTGPEKSLYKKYNIETAKLSDDYGSIREVIQRRLKSEIDKNTDKNKLPEILLIDGGIGQLNIVSKELINNHLQDKIVLLGICKGDRRKSDNDRILFWNYLDNKITELELEFDTKRLLQMLRDEAHRFAIKSMQQKRSKKAIGSLLEEIPGLGKKRIQKILEHFGGWAEVKKATKEQLQQIPGISDKLSSIILDTLKKYKY